MILDFHPKIGTRSPLYDKISLYSSLLNGKAIEIESFLQSIIFPPKNVLLKFAFLFVLTVFLLSITRSMTVKPVMLHKGIEFARP